MAEFNITAFALFCAVATLTPGPNNMINLAQGMRLGFWRAMPFAIGTGLGVGSLLFAVALGLGAAIASLPGVTDLMRLGTTAYLLYLAWKIAATAGIEDDHSVTALGFWGGIGFQWINPKTWFSSLAMATTYLPANPAPSRAFFAAAVFCAIAWVAQPIWIGFGNALKHLFSSPGTAMIVNAGLAILLLASTLPFLWLRD